ncbi:hypothetical protein L2E82_45761 [Cichorium intybus]|uniref:Uncharacterized protein n=1 Tax=Cichorium intybus TaxID=13427 RepID=A0ACB8ZUE7_CICIN|nr:hypothetical protein L2E82_45761 [Cichorium intybus]
MESMKSLPSGAGKILELNDVILGESLASEENDLVFPDHDFSKQALVTSPQQLDANLIESILWKFNLAVPNEFVL